VATALADVGNEVRLAKAVKAFATFTEATMYYDKYMPEAGFPEGECWASH
jgi:hypothetical protein